jgi:type VI secretion system protein ImpH
MSQLEDFVFANAESIEFFQLVRLLHQIYPDRKGVGEYSARLDQEVARFGVPSTLGFPAGEVAKLDPPTGDTPARMLVNFMGLVGPEGVLPLEYTLLVDDRVRHRDTGLRDFLDIFHHRIVSIFYRAWERTNFFAALERGKPDRLSEHVADLAGIGVPEVQANLPVDTESLLYYAGLLAPHQRSAAALEQLIADYFDVDATVVQFTGRWYDIDTRTQCALGEERGESDQLGFGAVVGDAVYDPQAGVRIRLGPLSRQRYADFLPGAAARRTLRDVVRFFAGDHLDVELQLVLKADDVPACRLGADHETPLALGWYTWLHTSSQMSRDPDDTVLSL